MSMSDKFETLRQEIISKSVSSSWRYAKYEWDVIDCIEDEGQSCSCVCGQENLKYLYTIRNHKNGNELYPIGSRCIKHFERDEMSTATTVWHQIYQIHISRLSKGWDSLKNAGFTKNVLRFMYNQGAFYPSEYNHNNPAEDYEFLLDMFNKRTAPSERQNSKIYALMKNAIIPWLNEHRKSKGIDRRRRRISL